MVEKIKVKDKVKKGGGGWLARFGKKAEQGDGQLVASLGRCADLISYGRGASLASSRSSASYLRFF